VLSKGIFLTTIQGYMSLRTGEFYNMPSAMVDLLLAVAKGLVKICKQYIQINWYITWELIIVSATKGTEWLHMHYWRPAVQYNIRMQNLAW